MEHYLRLLSMFILISSFVLVANKNVSSYIKAFRMQSLFLALVAAILGVHNFYAEGSYDILIVCIITIGVKVFYIPRLLKTTIEKVEYKVEKDFFLNIPVSILVSCGLVILTYYVVSTISGVGTGDVKMYLVNSISVVLIGLFFMISRKKAVSQIIGFLVIENGIFTTAILTSHGMPMIVELGVFFDLFTAVLIMGILVFKINKSFDSINIENLRKLRG